MWLSQALVHPAMWCCLWPLGSGLQLWREVACFLLSLQKPSPAPPDHLPARPLSPQGSQPSIPLCSLNQGDRFQVLFKLKQFVSVHLFPRCHYLARIFFIYCSFLYDSEGVPSPGPRGKGLDVGSDLNLHGTGHRICCEFAIRGSPWP